MHFPAMKNLENIYAHKDYNKIKGLCKQVKINKNLDIAAFILSKLIPNDYVVIPMPGHTGYATWSLKLADKLKLFRSDICIFDCLYEVPNDGVCESKKHKVKLTPNIIVKYGYIPPKKNAILLDNVYDTGSTYNAACEAIGKRVPIVVLGKTLKNK